MNLQLPSAPPPAILEAFGLTDGRARLVTDNPKKPVWRVEHSGRAWFLKQMPYAAPRVEFIIAAARHLRRNGMPTPEPQAAADGRPYATSGDQVFVLFPEVHGEEVEMGDARAVARALARFHRASEGFQPPPTAERQSALGDWPRLMRKKLDHLDAFERIARTRPHGAFEAAFLSALPRMRAAAERCLADLGGEAYQRSTEAAARLGVLTHQDFAPSNLLQAADGTLWVIDLDSIQHDVPARDLRKLLHKLLKKAWRFDAAAATRVVDAYKEERALSDDDVAVLWIDVRFPHLFTGIADKYFNDRGEHWTTEKFVARLSSIIAFEDSKAGAVPG